MNVALDLGTSHIRSLRRESDRLISRRTRTVYSVLPESAAHRQLLEQAGLRFTSCDDGIVLLGDAAYESADLFKVPCRPLLIDGALPANDPVARQLCSSLVEAILPAAEPPGAICCLAVPGGADVTGHTGRTDLEFFTRLVQLQGYEPRIIPASLALILAELVRDAFTGIGLVFGATGCEALLAHRGTPICHVRTTQGGDWLDAQLIRLFGSDVTELFTDPITGEPPVPADLPRRVQQQREQLQQPLTRPTDNFNRAVAKLASGIIEELLSRFTAEFARSLRAASVPQPVPLICAGGLSRLPGFEDLLKRSLKREPLPLALSTCELAAETSYTIPRGLLISAELEAAEQESAARSRSKAA